MSQIELRIYGEPQDVIDADSNCLLIWQPSWNWRRACTMRIVSWNIQHGGGTRAADIIAQIKRWQPDVVALSEFRGTAPSTQIRNALCDMNLAFQVSTVNDALSTTNGLLFASRFGFATQRGSGLLQESRRWLQINLKTPAALTLIALHVPNRDTGRKYDFHAEVVNALRPLSGCDALAFGDTNTGAAGIDEARKFFNKKETGWFARLQEVGWIDVWRKRNPDRREYTWYGPKGTGFRLDQVFAPTAFESRIRNTVHDWRQAEDSRRGPESDHAAIIIDVDA